MKLRNINKEVERAIAKSTTEPQKGKVLDGEKVRPGKAGGFHLSHEVGQK